MLVLPTSKRATVAIQLGAVWAVGAVALPAASLSAVFALYASGPVLFGLAVVVAGVAVLAFLGLVIAATRAVSVLGASGGGRTLWVLLVAGGGTAGWAVGWSVTDTVGLGVSGDRALTLLLGGVPFGLVAGLLLRGWWLRGAAFALGAGLVVAGVVVLRHESPDEFEARLAANQVQRDRVYVVAVPGYRPSGNDYGNGLGDGSFTPANPDAVPPDRYVTIAAYDQDRASPQERLCGQPIIPDAGLYAGDCTAEPGGLVYRNNGFRHGYQVRVGRLYVVIIGTAAVHHDLLRTAALSLHRATARELGNQEQTGEYYAARIPGYTGQATTSPASMDYWPTDRTGLGAQSVSVRLYVSSANGDTACFGIARCTPDGTGLTYFRDQDTHGYVMRRGPVDVTVSGGLRVDKALLRQAVRDARPATDEELRRFLPPVRPNTLGEKIREWVRGF